MSQGNAKILKGQQFSADSLPTVLSAEQEGIISNIEGSTSNTDNQLLSIIQSSGTAVSGMNSLLIGAENDSGNLEKLRSSSGSLYVRFASTPTVNANGSTVSITNASGGSAVNIQDGGNSITVDGTVSLGSGTAYAGKVRLTDGTTDAEVIPLTGYNAQAVAIVDGSGNQITSFGGGTQYTEDIAAASDPVGTVPILVRKDTPATITSTDGDNVAQRGTNYGAAYVQVVTSSGSYVDSFGSSLTTYGTDTSMTVTNLNSLANSQTAGWQSARVSNVSTRAKDYIIGIKLTMANTAPANDKAVYVYVCPFWTSDAGTTWYAASGGTTTLPSGSEGTYTIATPNNLRLLGILSYTTQNMVLQDTFLMSNALGNQMPQGFSLIIINYSGAAIAASTNLVSYTAIT